MWAWHGWLRAGCTQLDRAAEQGACGTGSLREGGRAALTAPERPSDKRTHHSISACMDVASQRVRFPGRGTHWDASATRAAAAGGGAPTTAATTFWLWGPTTTL